MSDPRRTVEVVWRIESPRLDRLAHPTGPGRRPGRGARAGRVRRGPRAVAHGRRPGQARCLVDDDRQAPGDRRDPTGAEPRRQVRLLAHYLADEAPADGIVEDPVGDDLLSLVFLTCHPVLPRESRIALTLRLFGGLTTDEIARAYLTPSTTIGQRISRAKRTLAEAHVPFEVPQADELPARIGSVLEVVYLIFTEGYAATTGDAWVRRDLADEAMRLGRVLAGLLPREPEVHGLVALMELQASRFDARGTGTLLQDQDRRRWDSALIEHGLSGAGHGDEPRPTARPLHAAGRDRRLPQPRAQLRGHRLGGGRRALRRARAARPEPRRRAQPRRRGAARRRAAGGARRPGQDRRRPPDGPLPPARRGAGGGPDPARTSRRGGGRAGTRRGPGADAAGAQPAAGTGGRRRRRTRASRWRAPRRQPAGSTPGT